MRSLAAFALVFATGSFFGCSSPAPLSTADDELAPLVAPASPDAGGGQASALPSASADDTTDLPTIARSSVVYLQRIVTGQDGLPHIGVCTGVVVAPNLVVTAHHCVSTLSTDATVCTLPGSDVVSVADTLTGNVDPRGVLVSLSADRVDGDEGSRLLRCSAVDAIAARLVDDGTLTMCDGHDVAWLILDRPIVLPGYPPIREEPLAVGESLVGYGWGKVSSDGPFTPTLKKIEAHVVAAESSSYPAGGCIDGDGDGDGAVGYGEFADDSQCFHGDSGGPLFDADGRLVSVRSRGAGGGGDCVAFTKSSRVSAYPDAMHAAFAQASAAASAPITRRDPGDACH